MAERKPLIAPDALPSTSISRIIQRDRENSGREAPESTEQKDEAIVPDVLPDPPELKQKAIALSSLPKVAPEPVENRSYNSKKELKKAIEDMTGTPLVTVSLKLPSGLNDWLDTYNFAHRKAGLRKQDLIAEAVSLLILEKSKEANETSD